MSDRVSVTSADFIRNIGHWQNEALHRPVWITHHGRERLVLVTPHELNRVGVRPEAEAQASDADAVFEQMEEAFLAVDASLRVKRINAAAEAFIGRSRETLVGADVYELPTAMRAALCERLRRVLRTGDSETFEATIDSRQISARAFPLAQGAAILFVTTSEQLAQRAFRC